MAAPVAGGDATVDVTGATLSALRATGEPGRGVIRGATDMGVAIADGRLYRLQLDVIPEGRPGFAVEHVTLVPAASLWRMVTGVTLPLFLDRTQPSRLTGAPEMPSMPKGTKFAKSSPELVERFTADYRTPPGAGPSPDVRLRLHVRERQHGDRAVRGHLVHARGRRACRGADGDARWRPVRADGRQAHEGLRLPAARRHRG